MHLILILDDINNAQILR